MTFLALLVGLHAGIHEDLETASNKELTEPLRMEAFNRLVLDYSNKAPELRAIAFDDDHDAHQRWIVVRVMGQTHSPKVTADLLKLTADPMPAMRAAAARALGDLGAKEASEVLGGLLSDDAMIVRQAAADSLGLLRSEDSARYLEAALKDGSNFYRGSSLWVRKHYVLALGEIGSETSIPALIACFDDKDEEVVDASLVALQKVVGFDFAEGRTRSEHIEAWRRWWANEKG